MINGKISFYFTLAGMTIWNHVDARVSREDTRRREQISQVDRISLVLVAVVTVESAFL